MKVTIQIVNFKSRDSLRRCLESLEKAIFPDRGLEIILVNNEAEPLLRDELPGGIANAIEILEMKENLGFGRAHNLGFQKAKGELILFLNPDTEVPENAIAEMADLFRRDPSVGIAGPRLVGSSGQTEEEHYGARKTPFSIIFSKFSGKKFLGGEDVFEADWISGGAMMIKKEIFSQLGGFDENFFLYFEDVDLCSRAKKRQIKIVVNPKAEIIHESGKSFEGGRKKKKYYYAAQDHYLRKNFGAFAAAIVKMVRLPLYIKNVYLER